jgi:hypothetical protein
MVDGIIELEDRLYEARSERALQIRKFRGAGSLRGRHAFRISDDGIEVFPRIEALFSKPPEAGSTRHVLATGASTLDALIASGGLSAASASVVVGSAGTGKTTLGLHFLAESTPQEPGMLFGFFESPTRLRMKARAFGPRRGQQRRLRALRRLRLRRQPAVPALHRTSRARQTPADDHQDARHRLRFRHACDRDRRQRHADCRSLHFGRRRHSFRRTVGIVSCGQPESAGRR